MDNFALPSQVCPHYSIWADIHNRDGSKKCKIDTDHRFRCRFGAPGSLHHILSYRVHTSSSSMDTKSRALLEAACWLAWDQYCKPYH